jgi:hypothetical protein
MNRVQCRGLPKARAAWVVGLSLCACAPWSLARAEMTLVRLTPEQYQQAIHDIFGTSVRVDQNKVEPGFREDGLLALGNRKLTVGSAELERDETLAQSIAAQVVDAKHRAVLVGCKPRAEQAPDNECARAFIKRVGLLLFRRPLTGDEVQVFVATQDEAAQRLHSFDAGLAAALARMLLAPQFLFRIENSTPDPAHPGTLRLDAWSRAARLSFFLWNTTPDTELLQAAQSGKLMTATGLQAQVERLLRSPRTEQGLRAFFVDMLAFSGLDQDPGFDTLSIDTNLYPRFIANVPADAEEQTLRTIVDQLLYRNGDYRDLFTTRDTFLTPALAAIYEVPLPRVQEMGGAIPWVPYHFGGNEPYIGILTQASFLSLHSHEGRTSPTRRGKALREVFLCQKVPPPPGNVDFSLVQNTNDPRYKTVRQRLTAHRNEPMCAGCHKIMDPIGLAFEDFDTASEYRTSENGAAIDVSGELSGKSFDGVRQLAQLIHDDPATTSCLINRVYAYGTDRKATAQEQAWLAGLSSELSKDGVRWRELMRRVTLNPDFYDLPVSLTLSAAATH